MSREQAAHLSIRAYRWLAQAFPEQFLRAHGEELLYVTEDLVAEVDARKSWAGFVPFVVRMFADLMRSIAVEYAREFRLDLRFAIRNLWRQKTFASVAIVSLSLGISMTTSMWTQLEESVFKTVPGVRDAAGLTALQRPVSYPVYERMRDASGQWEKVAAYVAPVPFVHREKGKSERLWGHLVSPNYFETLGVKAYQGRLLSAEDKEGMTPSAVITHRLWINHFGGARDILGRRLEINGQPVIVVGVAAPGFLGATPMFAAADLFLPVTVQAAVAPELGRQALTDRKLAMFSVVGRVLPRREVAQAEAALDTMVRAFEREHGDPARDQGGRRVTLLPGGRLIPVRNEDLPVMLGMPAVLIGLMLWIACANVATMLLAKALGRRKEIATRLALGASRARIVRQLLTESTLLAVLGGLLGVVWAVWSTRLIEIYRPMVPKYVTLEVETSWAAVWFTVVVSVVTGVLFGLAPALQATRADLATDLKSGSLLGVKGFRWFSSRNMLVLQQVAASLTLLLITGWVILGFNRTAHVDMGFAARDLWQFSVDPVRDGYGRERSLAFFAGMRERLAAVPGVTASGFGLRGPMSLGQNAQMMSNSMDMKRVGKEMERVRTDRVGVGFLEALEVPVTAGRLFRESDVKEGALVTVINETLRKQRFGGRDPVGQFVELEEKPHRIVGVVRDIRSGFMLNLALPNAYLPLRDEDLLRPLPEGITLVARTRPGLDGAALVRQAVALRDTDLTVFNAAPVQSLIDQNFYLVRVITWTYGGIGAYGLLLAAIGLAGVTAHAVVRRTKEIGIRVALGAPTGSVLRLVLQEGFWLTVIGAGLGIGTAWAVTILLATYLEAVSRLTETTMTDPVLIAAAPALLVGLALAACYWPARRASRIDPIVALREE